jgi:hypothetical protein
VGIYNSYWSSFGGGERHALDLADIACKANCEVYLISESPFSLDKLQRFFNIIAAKISPWFGNPFNTPSN